MRRRRRSDHLRRTAKPRPRSVHSMPKVRRNVPKALRACVTGLRTVTKQWRMWAKSQRTYETWEMATLPYSQSVATTGGELLQSSIFITMQVQKIPHPLPEVFPQSRPTPILQASGGETTIDTGTYLRVEISSSSSCDLRISSLTREYVRPRQSLLIPQGHGLIGAYSEEQGNPTPWPELLILGDLLTGNRFGLLERTVWRKGLIRCRRHGRNHNGQTGPPCTVRLLIQLRAF
eukprot:gene22475-biopygen1179